MAPLTTSVQVSSYLHKHNGHSFMDKAKKGHRYNTNIIGTAYQELKNGTKRRRRLTL